MKYRHLLLANLLRRRIRTGLTVGSFAVALFLFGTGPIKGFAVTLCLGIAINLFTALVGTKVIFDVFNQRQKVETLSI